MTMGKDYADSNLAIVAISANDAANYPDDAPDKLKNMATELGFIFPFCYDESQETINPKNFSKAKQKTYQNNFWKYIMRSQVDEALEMRSLTI